MEGIVTVAVAVTVPWILPDSPQLCNWLTPAEKAFIDRRLARDSGTSEGRVQTQEGYSWRSIKSALLDWKIWFCCLIYNGASITIYGFTYTVPTIIVELGYTASRAQLMTIPLYLGGVIATVAFARFSDKKKLRWPSIVIPFAIALVGFIGLIAIPHPKLPGWVGNNLAPTWKRAVGMGLLITLGNYGGAVG